MPFSAPNSKRDANSRWGKPFPDSLISPRKRLWYLSSLMGFFDIRRLSNPGSNSQVRPCAFSCSTRSDSLKVHS
ncbi:hypothetical protein NITMOv2_3143 [Nitrospira moscoviensis]|uniref:Uncharacterized protein n=1 Tax=Nitrospira moscoviensis TaxID=42253 RepID=A0A0K2GG06_NITMO|nr:hypothetical protein NITMOv2_3143 [Nitrospira moscoviensis]